MRLIAIAVFWALCGTATAEEPPPYEWQWRVSAGAMLGSLFSHRGALPIGPRVAISVQTHPIFEWELGMTFITDSKVVTLWALEARVKLHPTLGPKSVKRFYLLVGLGAVGELEHDTVGAAFQIGGGYVVPLWNHIGFQVELSYVYATTQPHISATLTSIGLEWEF